MSLAANPMSENNISTLFANVLPKFHRKCHLLQEGSTRMIYARYQPNINKYILKREHFHKNDIHRNGFEYFWFPFY